MDMREGQIVSWVRSAGESVDEDDELAEVETAKAVEMVIAPCSGRLVEICVEAGVTVPVGSVLAVIDELD
jgi:pyruvate/2-oxoglutarate dehydrogenase complex dihydrolipoamide acyltransferase (E2) component